MALQMGEYFSRDRFEAPDLSVTRLQRHEPSNGTESVIAVSTFKRAESMRPQLMS
jgi:hypothetical protein